MAKEAYLGVSAKARSIAKIYIGVGAKARRVTAGYIGVGGVARCFYKLVRYGHYELGDRLAAYPTYKRTCVAGAYTDDLAVFAGGGYNAGGEDEFLDEYVIYRGDTVESQGTIGDENLWLGALIYNSDGKTVKYAVFFPNKYLVNGVAFDNDGTKRRFRLAGPRIDYCPLKQSQTYKNAVCMEEDNLLGSSNKTAMVYGYNAALTEVVMAKFTDCDTRTYGHIGQLGTGIGAGLICPNNEAAAPYEDYKATIIDPDNYTQTTISLVSDREYHDCVGKYGLPMVGFVSNQNSRSAEVIDRETYTKIMVKLKNHWPGGGGFDAAACAPMVRHDVAVLAFADSSNGRMSINSLSIELTQVTVGTSMLSGQPVRDSGWALSGPNTMLQVCGSAGNTSATHGNPTDYVRAFNWVEP